MAALGREPPVVLRHRIQRRERDLLGLERRNKRVFAYARGERVAERRQEEAKCGGCT